MKETKRVILDNYIKKHKLPTFILEKIDIASFHTDNFVYKALRIGNNIGDIIQISMDIIFLQVIAKKYNLIFDMTDYPELHTNDISEEELDKLVNAAKLFENRNDKLSKEYDKIIKKAKEFLVEEFEKII